MEATPTSGRFGRPGKAYQFSAKDGDYVEVPHNNLLSFGTNDFTIVAWVRFCEEQVEYAGIVCKDPPNNSYPGYQLHIGSGEEITTQFGDNANGWDERRGTKSLNDGEWHMLAVTVSSRNNTIAIGADTGQDLTRTDIENILNPNFAIASVRHSYLNGSEIELTLYPNPAKDQVHLQFSLQDAGDITVELFDVTGRLVNSPVKKGMTAGRQNLLFSAEELKSGVYILHLTTNQGVISRQIVVQH